MKTEVLLDAIGEIDEKILEQHRQMELRLERKHVKKRAVSRLLVAAACIAVLLCVCVPAGMMMAHPAGRAVLRGDSEALTEQLHKIDGFVLWQDETAQKLEQSLPAGMWTLLQKTPVLNVLTQSEFAAMKPQEAFTEGIPYRLYFVSNGDGTCTLEYITIDPAFTGEFVIEIPETSPDGDTVTAIDIYQPGLGGREMTANVPTVLTAGTMESLLLRAKKNGISDFDYAKLCAFYLKLSVTGLDENARCELLNAYPIAAYGDVYVLDNNASTIDQNRIYKYLTEYCEWDAEQYEQSVQEICRLAKQSESRELAELCLTIFRCKDLRGAVGVTIPKTVTSINGAMWARLPALESVTVDAEHPTLKMIDGCLVDTSSGTLALYLREDGSFPEGLDLRILDSYAFAACTLQANANGEGELHIPEGVTEIREDALTGISVEDAYSVHIHLPKSLAYFAGFTSKNYHCEVIYHYPGTMSEWANDVSFGTVNWDCAILLQTSDVTDPTVFHFPRRFS